MRLNSRNTVLFVFPAMLFIIGMALRLSGLTFISLDMRLFLIPWYDTLARDGFHALREFFSNYSPPYLYLLWLATLTQSLLPKAISIKLISIFFDLVNSLLVYKVLKLHYPKGMTANLGTGIFFVLPTVLLNSSFWGQADGIYTTFILACLYYLLAGKSLEAVIFFGIAFAFKAQSIFLLPLLILFTVKNRIPWFYYGLVPIIYLIIMIPALIAGRPLMEVFTVYLSQADTYRMLSLDAPNFYLFVPESLYSPGVIVGIILTIIITVAWIWLYSRKITIFTPSAMLLCATVSVAMIPFFMPKMHDRYFYLAEVFSLLLAFYLPKLWFLPLAYQFISVWTYAVFLLYKSADIFPTPPIVAINMLIIAALANTALTPYLLWKQYNLVTTGDVPGDQQHKGQQS